MQPRGFRSIWGSRALTNMQLTEMEAQADGRHHGAAGWTDGSPERGQTERAEWQASWQCDGAPEGSHARRGYAEAKRADVLEALLISQNHPVAGHLALHPGHPAQPTFKGRLYLSAESRSSHQKFECSDGHRRSHPERYQPIAFRRSQWLAARGSGNILDTPEICRFFGNLLRP